MSDVDWPSPEPSGREPAQRPPALPRVEDLPISEQGYDREKVQEAFDAFYRHAAQLDATLRTLESVEVFQRTAAELRAELRTIRGSGLSVGSWQSGAGSGYGYGERSRVGEWSLPPAAPRVAAEALFLIVIGVIVGVAGWPRLTIVLVMALALGIVWLVEWVASRERAIPHAAAPAQAPALDEPAELEAAPPPAVQQDEGPEAMTMYAAEEVVEAEPALEPEPEPPVVSEDTAEEQVVFDDEDELPEAAASAVAVLEDTAEEEPDLGGEPVAEVAEAEPEEPEQPDEEERSDDAVALALAVEALPEKRRFRLFRRGSVVAPAVVDVAAENIPGEVEDPASSPEPSVEPGPDLEPEEPEEPAEPEQRVDPWEEPGRVPEPELLAVVGEPEPELGAEPEPELEPEAEVVDLPVEAVAEQAAAGLERSRSRRRPRRARRR